jgi:hypothetical protein
MAVGQALLPVEVGAVVVAAVEVTLTSAVSVAPVLSVTVSRSRSVPAVGATACTVAALAPETIAPPVPASTTLHEWVLTLRPQDAADTPPCSVKFCPADTEVGNAKAAIGRRAARTAPTAFAMPAPQVAEVQAHSLLCVSFDPSGSRHSGMPAGAAG